MAVVAEEEMEAELLVFENEDGKEETFEVIGVFEVEEKEYIALQSQEDGSILLCKYMKKKTENLKLKKLKTMKNSKKFLMHLNALVEEDDE